MTKVGSNKEDKGDSRKL